MTEVWNELTKLSRVWYDKLIYVILNPSYVFTPVQRSFPERKGYIQRFLIDTFCDASFIFTTENGSDVYLGSAFNAADDGWLRVKHITTIINATFEISNFFDTDFEYFNFPADDTILGELKKGDFERFCDIVDNAFGNVLVHCYAGRSRSAVLVLYYLITRLGFTKLEALNLLQQHREQININEHFMRTIDELTKK